MIWLAVLLGSLACYALKLAGLSLPRGWLAKDGVRQVGDLLPVALLAALVAIQTVTVPGSLVVDARVAGMAAAVAALLLRAPFLVVVAVAAVVTALARLLL